MPDETTQNQILSNKNIARSLVILGVVLIVLVFIVVFIKVTTPKPIPTTVSQPQATIEIKSDADLKKLEDEVKGVDIDGLSNDLDLNDKDASEF